MRPDQNTRRIGDTKKEDPWTKKVKDSYTSSGITKDVQGQKNVEELKKRLEKKK